MKNIPFLDSIISNVKKSAKIGESPTAYFKDKDGKLVISLISLPSKHQIRLSLYTLMLLNNPDEIVFVNEGWMVQREGIENLKGEVCKQEDKQECFLVNYFTKDICTVHTLIFKRGESGNLNWTEELNYKGNKQYQSLFNPFTMSKEDVEKCMILSKQDKLREEGELERIGLIHNFHIDVYRLDGEVFFEAFNDKNKVFGNIAVQLEDESFERALDEMKKYI